MYLTASYPRQNICINAYVVPTREGDYFMFIAMDEYSQYVIAYDLFRINSDRTWAAFIRTKVLSDPAVAAHDKPINFFLRTDPECIELLKHELTPKHNWLLDDGRCVILMKDFIDGFIGRSNVKPTKEKKPYKKPFRFPDEEKHKVLDQLHELLSDWTANRLGFSKKRTFNYDKIEVIWRGNQLFFIRGWMIKVRGQKQTTIPTEFVRITALANGKFKLAIKYAQSFTTLGKDVSIEECIGLLKENERRLWWL